MTLESLENRCLLTGGLLEVELVSTGDPGDPTAQVGNNDSTRPAISGDGRYVAFVSDANNLTPGDLNDAKDVFVKDLYSGALTLVSTAADGTQGNADASSSHPSRPSPWPVRPWEVRRPIAHPSFPQISANGRYVTFGSFADNLVPVDGNEHIADIFVKDLATGDVRLVSNAQDGAPADDAAFASAISDDGTWLVFSSDANNLLPDDGNLYGTDVFVRNLLTGDLTRLTHDDEGTGSYFRPGISANGRYVTFDARNGDYVPGDTNGAFDIFRVDLHNGPAGDVQRRGDTRP